MSVKAKDFVKMFTKEEILEALFNDREFRFARMQIRICRVLYEKKSDKLLAELEKTGENFQKCKKAAQWVDNNKKYERIDKQLEKLNKDFEALEVQP